MQLPNIDFLKQFRKADPALPREARLGDHVYIKHFGRSRKQRGSLEKYVKAQVLHSPINLLMNKMQQEDAIITRRLMDSLRTLMKRVTHDRRYHYPADFISRLSAETFCFKSITFVYQTSTQIPLQNSLRNAAAGSPADSHKYIGSRDIHRMQAAVGHYLEEVYYYHDTFAALLEEELGRTATSAVSSRAEDALLKLTTVIKSLLFALEATGNGLRQWKKTARRTELQVIYN